MVILCEMFVHNIKQNKMFMSYVFIMFAYEMSFRLVVHLKQD